MPAKYPGKPVRGSSTGRPIMVLLDVLGQKWTLRVLWELQAGCVSFRTLRGLCDDASPTSLHKRLRELRELNLVELKECGFQLTEKGTELTAKFADLHLWAEEWSKSLNK